MRAERRAYLLIVASRGLSEAVGVTVAAALLHAATAGRGPLALVPAALAVFGIALVLAAALRERGTVRQSTGLAAALIVGSAAWSLTLAARPPDALAVLTRVIGFGILGEVFLWRALGIARGLQRWREVRDDALLALLVVVVAAVAPGPIDRDALPLLGLSVAVAGAVALSLARATEELTLGGGQVEGRPVPQAATGTAFALGALAIGVAAVLPTAQALLAQAARAVGPPLGDLLYTLLLPLGYVASWFVAAAVWLRDALGIGELPPLRIPGSPFANDDELQRALREAEEGRPFVFGAIEVIVAVIALAFAAALVARLASERRALVPEGVELEREGVDGIGLRATFGSLFPRRGRERQAPPDDGTAAGRLRRVYWRLLDLAEREGPGRRAVAETPAEHEARLVLAAERWRDAAPIVRAFEDLRYGERDIDDATAARAAGALRQVERAR